MPVAVALTQPAGVMDASYARDRAVKRHLQFRLRVRAQLVVRAVQRYGHGAPLRLLDIGAAEGRTLSVMAESLGPGEYIGVEYDRSLLEAAGPLPDGVSLIAGDAMRLPSALAEGSFDAVSMLALLEHLPDPQAALREAFRILRPGGLIVCTCPHPLWDSIAGRLGLVADEHHMARLDTTALSALVESGGFTVLEQRRFMWAPVAILPYARIPVPPGLSLAVDACIRRVPLLRSLMVNGCVIAQKPPRQ